MQAEKLAAEEAIRTGFYGVWDAQIAILTTSCGRFNGKFNGKSDEQILVICLIYIYIS